MKAKLFFTILLVSCLSAIKAQTGVTIIDSILSGGIQRKFRLYKPNSYTGNVAVPLILNLHGYTSNALQQQLYGNFMPIADTANFLIVHPEGTGAANQQFWNAGLASSPNDINFLNTLIDSLKVQYNIDANCVYSCGMSNGGIMSYYMAALSNSKIAAIASVTGTMFNPWLNTIPGRIVPVMEIHGTNDATVPYNGNASNNMASIDTVLKRWRSHNACNSSSLVTNVPNINTTDGATAINYKFYNSNGKAYVEHYRVVSGAHTWPGAAFVVGVTCQDFNASLEIWRFFRQFKLNQFIITSLIDNVSIDNTIQLFPNPSQEFVVVKSDLMISKASVYSTSGQLLFTSNTATYIDLKALSSGVYLLKLNSEKGIIVKKIVKD
jgi:polyhydroxybutyrate depolymerase